MGARRKARELALQMLYQHDMSGNAPDMIIDTFEDLQKSKPNTREFADENLPRHGRSPLRRSTSMIQAQADNWRLSRMAVVDRNIIRMSIYEFLHESDTPKLVMIDEAIEIAKKFGNAEIVAVHQRHPRRHFETLQSRLVSLLGRLEDLSLTDIIQIVYLSRRTGVLEIVDDRGRHTVLFRQGLVVNASSPEHPDLLTYLVATRLDPRGRRAGAAADGGERHPVRHGGRRDEPHHGCRSRRPPFTSGSSASSRRCCKAARGSSTSSSAIRSARSTSSTTPTRFSRKAASRRRRSSAPRTARRLKPLRGLEESLKVGQGAAALRLHRHDAAPTLDLGLGQPKAPELRRSFPTTTSCRFRRPRNARSTTFTPVPDDEPFPGRWNRPTTCAAPAPKTAQRLGGPVQSRRRPDRSRIARRARIRNVVLFERNPLIRVAARRAFGRNRVKIAQFGTIDDARVAIGDFIRANTFFVTFLELDGCSRTCCMQQLKRKNPRLPVVIIDAEADLRRRHDLLRRGADLYLTKPSPARLQPGLAEEELAPLRRRAGALRGARVPAVGADHRRLGPDAGTAFLRDGGERERRSQLQPAQAADQRAIESERHRRGVGDDPAAFGGVPRPRGALHRRRRRVHRHLRHSAARTCRNRVKSLRIRARASPRSSATSRRPARRIAARCGARAANVELIDRLGGVLPTEVVALPIMHAKRTIGILYGDNAEHRAPIDTMTGLEIFLSQAGYAFGNAVFAAEKARTYERFWSSKTRRSMRAYLTTIIEGGTEAYDLEIVEAASGFEALKTLPHHKFDAILTDINMPDINGLELVSFLKNHPVYRTIPIMVISTESREEDRKRAAALGAEEYLVKPFQAADLIEKLRRLLKVA